MARRKGSIVAVGCTLCAMSAGASAGQDDPAPVLDIRLAGVEAIEPAAKDRALYDALPRLGERLTELPVEIALLNDEDPIEAAMTSRMIDLVWSTLLGEAGLVVQPGTGPFGYGLSAWSNPAGDVGPDDLIGVLGELLIESALSIEETDAGRVIATPFGRAPLRTADDDTLTVRLGVDDAGSLAVQRFDLPRGATPLVSAHVNLRELTAPLSPLLQAQDPMLRQQFFESGLIGPDAYVLDFALGTDDSLAHAALRYRDSARLFDRFGAGPGIVVSERDLRVVPVDATALFATPFDLSTFARLGEQISQASGEDVFGEIERTLGVDVAGMFGLIGPRAIVYQSDSTGGGGLLSTVFMVDLRDAERFGETVDRVTNLVNDFGETEANGYVRIAEREVGGHQMSVLAFPGLPVPLELSFVIHGDRLVGAASPLGLAAALDQIETPRRHIGQSSAFRSAVGGRMPRDGASAVYFVDIERFATQGYAIVTLALAGMSNGLANPAEPGAYAARPLMPSYAEFIKDIEPLGGVAVWEGEDYVFRLTTDRSFAVNAAAVASQHALLQGGTVVGALLPALGNARESAQELKSSTQVRAIVAAGMMYAADHRDQYPESLDVLVQGGFIDEATLRSPFGPAWDGGPDYAWAGGVATFDPTRIVAIDRAMYLMGGDVCVAFDDAHVDVVPAWELDQMLEQPQNEGVRERLGID